MTGYRNPEVDGFKDQRPSLLPFDPADLVALRVLPAQFAGMVGVSKQTVSRWIKKGIVTLGPDGKIDPSIGAREVIQRTDPNRMRARVFKSALLSHRQLQTKIVLLEGEIEKLKAENQSRFVLMTHNDDLAQSLSLLIDKIIDSFPALSRAYKDEKLEPSLDEIVAGIFYPESTLGNELESDGAPTAPSANASECVKSEVQKLLQIDIDKGIL